MSKYIVTKDNPYYPSVEYRDSMEEAQKQKHEWLEEMHEEDGTYKAKIIIAEIIEEQDIKTYF